MTDRFTPDRARLGGEGCCGVGGVCRAEGGRLSAGGKGCCARGKRCSPRGKGCCARGKRLSRGSKSCCAGGKRLSICGKPLRRSSQRKGQIRRRRFKWGRGAGVGAGAGRTGTGYNRAMEDDPKERRWVRESTWLGIPGVLLILYFLIVRRDYTASFITSMITVLGLHLYRHWKFGPWKKPS